MLKMQQVIEVMPEGSLEVLSLGEVDRLLAASDGGQHETLRRCALAVLNVGSRTDDAREVLEQYADFDISIVQQHRGIKLSLVNAPADAFVDGEMIRGIRELLFAVLRDVVFVASEVEANPYFDLNSCSGITNAIFHILRNAGVLRTQTDPDMVVCWGGHAINRHEYDYTKEVGYQLGLRALNVCTGCGSGAMKGPMKGATIAHAKQRIRDGRYVGITEPGIIAAESPNPIVNQLVIMPDIEKRLEAFVRIAHAIVIFPGGVGTAEELLYLLGVLMHPDNVDVPLPLLLAGPECSAEYFQRIDEFILATLGKEAQQYYTIDVGDPIRLASRVAEGVQQVKDYRFRQKDAFFYNWRLHIDRDFQLPFEVTHESMAGLDITTEQHPYELAGNLRRAFSGLVTGNVKEHGIRAIESRGPFEIRGENSLMKELDGLLDDFVKQKRMRLPGAVYNPCYKIAF
jgi:predicted Rossmann-fold nucleotide-binding protein